MLVLEAGIAKKEILKFQNSDIQYKLFSLNGISNVCLYVIFQLVHIILEKIFY